MAENDVLLALAFALVGLSAAAVLLLLVRRNRALATMLTRDEWLDCGKLVSIVLMIFLLMLIELSNRLPPELFLYGRF